MPDGWNYAAALERVGNDKSLLAELIAIFFEEYPKFAGRLTRSLAQKDFAALREAAHSLKGSLGYLSAADGEALACALERASLAHDSAQASDLLAQLMNHIETLRHVMVSPPEEQNDANCAN